MLHHAYTLAASAFAFVLIAAAPAARADTVEYYGPHPIDPSVGEGMCWIEGPHVHVYAPRSEALYEDDGPYHTFVGDPTEFDHDAPHYAYYGHHPVWWVSGPGEHYCYITGPHYHLYEARESPVAVDFVWKNDAYWYVGARPAWYPRRAKEHAYVDAYYARPGVIVRPAVVYAPPSGWVGVSFSIGIGVPGMVEVVHEPSYIIVHEHEHHWPPAWGHYKDKKWKGHGDDDQGEDHGGGKHRGKGKWR